MRICILTENSRLFSEAFVNRLREFGETAVITHLKSKTSEELETALRESDIAITGWGTPLLPEPKPDWKLRYICHLTGELKKIIPFAYFEKNIQVTNWGDSYSFATAEGAVALLFGVLKELPEVDEKIRAQGNAGDRPRPFCTLYKTRVGIYGLSTIGRLVAEYLKPFRPVLSFYDPTIRQIPEGLLRYDSLDALFANNDVVTIHTGLNDHTRGTVDYRRLKLLPEGGALINTARGPIVKEADLARILKEGRIKAGIDVIEDELDWRKSPLAECANVILTGHHMSIIGPLEKITLQETALENIGRFVRSEPLKHIVTSERYRLMT